MGLTGKQTAAEIIHFFLVTATARIFAKDIEGYGVFFKNERCTAKILCFGDASRLHA